MKRVVFVLVSICIMTLLSSCNAEDNCQCSDEIFGHWEVEQFISLESKGYQKDNNYNPIIDFKRDGTIDILLDINSCFGDFELGEDSTINVDSAGCTEVCCDSDFSNKFVEMLPQVGSYEIDGKELKLKVSGWGWIELEFISD